MPNNLPAVPDHFGGRNMELYDIISAVLKDGRLITITGPFGIGKSALAVAAGRYMADRRHFQGVFFVRIQEWVGAKGLYILYIYKFLFFIFLNFLFALFFLFISHVGDFSKSNW